MTNKRLNLKLLPLLLFILLLAFLLKGLFSDPRERDSALIGKPLPEFALPDLYQQNLIHTETTLGNELP